MNNGRVYITRSVIMRFLSLDPDNHIIKKELYNAIAGITV